MKLLQDCCYARRQLRDAPSPNVLAEMQKALNNKSWHEAVGSQIKTYLGFNSIHLCMRFLRSHGHLEQAARIEAALEAAAGRLSEDKDDDVDPTID